MALGSQVMEMSSKGGETMNGLSTLSLAHIDGNTPMGGNLLGSGEGATFRVWAPAAREVRVLWDYTKTAGGDWRNNGAANCNKRVTAFGEVLFPVSRPVRDTCTTW